MEASSNNYGLAFAPNRSKKNLLILYIICGLFICIGLVVLLADLGRGELTLAGLGVTSFATLMLVVGHFFTSPLHVAYFVGKDCLVLKQSKKILSIPYSDIESLTHLKEKQGEAFLLQLQNRMTDTQIGILAKSPGNVLSGLKTAFQEQKRAYEKYKFLSVAIAYSSSGKRRGPNRPTGTDLPCDTIFILQKNGEGYLISPLDIKGFMAEAKKYLPA